MDYLVRWIIAGMLAMAPAAPVLAQGVDDGGTVLPMTYTQPGWAERAVVNNKLLARTRDFEDRRCVAMGCLIILNQTTNYVVTAMYFVRGERDRVRQWTPNQFDRPLVPRTMFYAPKAGDDSMCSLPVRLVLRDIDTKETLEIEGVTSLCRRDKASAVLRVNVVRPSVTVTP